MNEFSSPIGAFIFLMCDYDYILLDLYVFVPYRGFYFLNLICLNPFGKSPNRFSSPIGAFIFLIKKLFDMFKAGQTVFVPYRGFYFLNIHCICIQKECEKFSSPIGAFIFLIRKELANHEFCIMFSSPIGAFIFLIGCKNEQYGNTLFRFRPLSGLLFS